MKDGDLYVHRITGQIVRMISFTYSISSEYYFEDYYNVPGEEETMGCTPKEVFPKYYRKATKLDLVLKGISE